MNIKHLTSNVKLPLLFAICYLLFAILFTWPVILRPSSSIYGYSGDSFGTIHYYWWWKYTKLRGLPFKDSFLEEAPFGVTFDDESGAILYHWPLKLLTYAANPVFAYNFLLILSFPLSGLTMYLLAYEVTRNRWASFWAGFAFSFAPYHFWQAFNHLDLAMIWPLPLYVWGLLKLEEKRRHEVSQLQNLGQAHVALGWRDRIAQLRNIILAGLLLAVAGWINLYYMFFLGLFTVAFLLAKGLLVVIRYQISKIKDQNHPEKFASQINGAGNSNLKTNLESAFAYLMVLVISIALVAPFNLRIIRDSLRSVREASPTRQETYDRPLLNLVSLSARPWDYLIPSPNHPILGKLNEEFYAWIRTLGSNPIWNGGEPNERTVFVGFTTILLAGIAFYSAVRAQKSKLKGQNHMSNVKTSEVPILFLTALLLVLVSMPPYIYFRGITVNLPSFYLHKIFPMFRAYVRLGVVVQLCLIVVASFGLSSLLEKVKNSKLKIQSDSSKFKIGGSSRGGFIFSCILLLSIIEFLNFPPFNVTDFSNLPPEYEWLKNQPTDTIVVHYPKSFSVADELLMQTFHEKAFLNFHVQSYYYDLWRTLEYFDIDYRVPEKLAALGIDYVFVHKKLLFDEPNPIDSLWYTRALAENSSFDSSRLMAGFQLVTDFNKTSVLKIDVPEPPLMVVLTKKAGEYQLDWPRGHDLVFSKSDNRIYLENLVEKDNPQSVRARLVFNGQNVSSLSFNGVELDQKASEFELELSPFENVIEIRGVGEVKVQDVSLEVLSE